MKTISCDKKVFAVFISIVGIAMTWGLVNFVNRDISNVNSVTEDVRAIYDSSEPLTDKIRRNKKTTKPILTLIPFISKHWNLPYRKAQQIVNYAFLYGKKYGIDPLFILSEIATESSFRDTAYSNQSAVGIMQVYPKAHWNYVLKHHYTGKRYYQLFHLRENIRFGAYILATDLHAFGSMNAAAAHYFGICSFDKTYVRRIDNNYKLLYEHYYT